MVIEGSKVTPDDIAVGSIIDWSGRFRIEVFNKMVLKVEGYRLDKNGNKTDDVCTLYYDAFLNPHYNKELTVVNPDLTKREILSIFAANKMFGKIETGHRRWVVEYKTVNGNHPVIGKMPFFRMLERYVNISTCPIEETSVELNDRIDEIASIMYFTQFRHSNVLPSVMDYKELLGLVCSRTGLPADKARSLYGKYTYKQWAELINSTPAPAIKLTEEEDALYGKIMGDCLNAGMSEEDAEKETLEELKSNFPRLKDLFVGDFKIAP